MEYVITVGLIAMLISLIFGIFLLKKELDTKTAIVYGIYGIIIITFWIFVLIGLKQGCIVK